MPDDVEITQTRGDALLGRGADHFAVYVRRSDSPVLVGRYPRTAAGWFAAWQRFEEVAVRPDSATPVAEPREEPPHYSQSALVLLVIGLALGVVSLFPSYLHGSALTGESDQLAEHLIFLVGWAGVALALAFGGTWRHRAGVFGVGMSVMAFGFYLSDLGILIADGAHAAGAGLIIGAVGWLLCSEGCVLGALGTHDLPAGGSRLTARPMLVALAATVSIGLAITFAPAWDNFRLYFATSGQSNAVTAGNAFSNPAPVIAANVIVIVLIVVLSVIAALWRRSATGAFLLAGALVPMVAQFISAIVQVGSPGPLSFGISPAQAAAEHLQISASFTPAFYLYCAFVVALALVCVAVYDADRAGRIRRPITASSVPVSSSGYDLR